jgi:small nuclear ribonucleoprotein (snRNP)-like protein
MKQNNKKRNSEKSSKRPKSVKDEMKGFLLKNVVVDTTTPIIYIGRLADISDNFIVLEDVDVHDTTEGTSTKEVYCIEARKFGVKKNRRRVLVMRNMVVSVSLLEDVIEY